MEREKIAEKDRWNVAAVYASWEVWNKEFAKWQKKGEEVAQFRGRLKEGSKTVLQLLTCALEIERHLDKLYTYAHLRHDEDVGNDAHKQAYLKILTLGQELRENMCWIEPELLSLSGTQLKEIVDNPELASYKFYLEKIIRLKPHTLDAQQEQLLASASLALSSTSRAFGTFNNADLKFPSIQDSKGQMHELTHGKYLVYMRSPDRELRKNAFQALHRSFGLYENTLCELIQGEIQKHQFLMKSRNFSSCLQAALFPHNIDTAVYTNLITTVRKNLPALHRYMGLRKEILKLEELHLYDMNVPLVADADISMGFDEAAKLCVDSVAPLGYDYQKALEKGFFQERWVDRFENNRKRSGAYSSGCYDTYPYILMNYHNEYNDIMTLAHEAGHSMHSYLSWKTQPYHYSTYPIFVAEVASTFNEELTRLHLLSTLQAPVKKAYLINQKIENIRATFFRQTMFAEFELKLHQWIEKGIPLTPALLKSEYRKLVVDYFGPAVTVDSEIDIEWARIPHFYYNFYVYQYATGIAASQALVNLVLKSGPETYLKFLSSGGSHFPLDLLQTAGVDMRTPVAIEATMTHFEELNQAFKEALILT